MFSLYQILNKYIKILIRKPLTFFWICGMIGNVLNWVFNWYMLQILNLEQYAFLTLLFTFQYWASIPAVALQTTINKFAAEIFHNQQPITPLLSSWRLSWLVGAAGFLLIFMSQSWLGIFFQVTEYQRLLLLAGIMIGIFFPFAWLRGIINARQQYHLAGILILVEGLVKLGLGYLSQYFPTPIFGASLTLPISLLVPSAIAFIIIAVSSIKLSLRGHLTLPPKFLTFFLNSSLLNIGVILPFTLDIALVKHYFPPEQAGIYAALTLIGKTVFFINYSIGGLLVPVMSNRSAKKIHSHKPLLIVICLVLLINIGTLISSIALPNYTIRFLVKDAFPLISPYLIPYLIAVACVSITAVFTTYNLIINRFLFPVLSLVAVVVEIIGISLFHSSLHQVVNVLLVTFLSLLIVVSALQYRLIRANQTSEL